MSGHTIEVSIEEREKRAWQMRVQQGATFDEIAKELGYANRSSAQKAFLRAAGKLDIQGLEDIARDVLERLLALMDKYYKLALEGDVKSVAMLLDIVDKILKFIDRNKPLKIEAEVINYDGNRNLNSEVIRIARVIEYIEGISADITTVPELEGQGEQNHLATPGAQGAVTS